MEVLFVKRSTINLNSLNNPVDLDLLRKDL